MAIRQVVDVDQTAGALSGATVVAFRPAPGRSTRPRVALEQRLARAGYAIAAHVVSSFEQSDTNTSGDSVVHMPNVIAVLATLAAECAQQAAALNRRQSAEVTANGWVLGGAADNLLFRLADGAPHDGVMTVWDVIADAAKLAGVTAAAMPDLASILAHAEAHIGTKPYPVLTGPLPLRPRILHRAAAARQRHATHGLASNDGLSTPHEQALALGAAIGHVLRHETDPADLLHLAAEMLIGAARLAPIPYAMN